MVYILIAAAVIVAFVLFIIWLVKSKPVTKGELGEQSVAWVLGKTVEGEQYVINDLLFADGEGHTCQIDHVYINRSGIWVIETKNYSGSIYGNETQREWTQVLAYGKEKNKFYNPVKQNTTHIYRLSDCLGVKGIFHNVVVFLRNADITNVSSQNVFSLEKLKTIKTLQTSVSLSVEEMERYYNKLLSLKENNTVSKYEHIENIRIMQDKVRRGICPRCGGYLVLRDGRNGKFFGCSNYPNCKFTKNINDD